MDIIEKIDKYLNEGKSVTPERKKEAEKGIKKNKKSIDKIDSVDNKGISHNDDSFISGKQAAEFGKQGMPKHLRDIVRAGTNLYIVKYGEIPPSM